MHPIRSLLTRLALACTLLFPFIASASGQGRRVLYVYNQTKLERVRAAVPPDEPTHLALIEAQRRNDEAVIAWLQSLHFTVTRADESSPLAVAQNQDLVIVSESSDAIDIATKYRTLAVPLLTFENDLLPDLGMTGQKNGRDYGTDEEQRFVCIINAPHPLAAGLAAGNQNVLVDHHFKMNWGRPVAGAIVIGTLRGEPDKAAIFAYDKGATMDSGFLAPARRVSFFLWADTFEQIRPEGLALFKAALQWAAEKPD